MRKTPTGNPLQLAYETVFEDYTERLLGLLDGLFVNFEDALFEAADRNADGELARHHFDLMRRVRTGRVGLEATFTSTLRRTLRLFMAGVDWRDADIDDVNDVEPDALELSRVSREHFSNLLEQLADRTTHLLQRDVDELCDLPFAPLHVARAFLLACETLALDARAQTIINPLCKRFIMDRLGPVLGQCNVALTDVLARPTGSGEVIDLGGAFGG